MTDIVRLGMQVDTSQLSEATVKLKSVAQAAAGVTGAAQKMSTSMQGPGVKLRDAIFAQIKAIDMLIERMDKVGTVTRKVTRETENFKKVAATPIPAAANTNLIPHDMRPNRFNTANIAAQFQDIGVTASMGMNPLTIAIQQGTQLSAIMNSMEKPLQGLGQAFASVINPVSLLSIGLVALVATGIQMVDWVSVGQSALLGMASALDGAAEGIAAFATSTPAMLTGMYLLIPATWSLVTGLYAVVTGAGAAATALVTAWIAANAPLAILMVSITGLSAALYAIFGDKFTTAVQNGINFMVGAVIGSFNFVVGLWEKFPSIMSEIWEVTAKDWYDRFYNYNIDVTNRIAELFGATQKLASKKIPVLDFTVNKPELTKLTEQFAKDMGTNWVGVAKTGVTDVISYTTGKMRSLSEYLGTVGGDKPKGAKGAKEGKTELDKYAEIEQSALRRIASLKAEQQALFMTSEEAAKLTFYTEMLNDAQQKGIVLTTEQKGRLGALATEMAAIQEETRKTEEAMDFLKTSTKGFFDDMKSGLEQGKGLWNSFLDAVTNVLNKLTDKIFEMQMDKMFSTYGQTSSGQGFLGQIASLFGGGGSSSSGLSSGALNLASQGSLNSIVTSPTLFGFAKGDAFGVMGEAGAEAVMPLHRGSDGSLGVKMSGGVGGTNVVVNVNNNSKANASVQQRETSNGIEIDVMIDEIVGSKLNERGSDSNRSARSINSQALIRR